MFERTKAKIRLRRICKALGVEPYPEMVRYVIDRDETIFRGGRRNGKTLALIIPCIEHMDSRRPSPIHADEKERVLRCECFTPIPEDEEGEK